MQINRVFRKGYGWFWHSTDSHLSIIDAFGLEAQDIQEAPHTSGLQTEPHPDNPQSIYTSLLGY